MHREGMKTGMTWHDTLAARNVRNPMIFYDSALSFIKKMCIFIYIYIYVYVHIIPHLDDPMQGFAVNPLLDSHLSARQNTVRGDRQPIAIQGERRLVQCT